ncbi:hypothetical protein FACS1894102_6740 [Spirochaetia bacterium]|nr:hypothetical protein FACS1894102_6740 [Spirochaetia bacterium]
MMNISTTTQTMIDALPQAPRESGKTIFRHTAYSGAQKTFELKPQAESTYQNFQFMGAHALRRQANQDPGEVMKYNNGAQW